MRRFLIALLALPTLVVVWAAPAQALSCVSPSDVIRDAKVVYLGHVIDSDKTRIQVQIDEIWKGKPVKDRQWFTVEMIGWSMWADGGHDQLEEGLNDPTPMVFAPDKGAVNACTSWGLDTPGVRKHRPANPIEPIVTTTTDQVTSPEQKKNLLPYAGGGVLLLVLAGAAWWRFRPSRR